VILYIANRGEIARRIIRSAKKLGIKTAVGYARQDKELPFVVEADLSVSLDGEEALETYLDSAKVIGAAKKLGATHLHPGYGFLSENALFVDEVGRANIKFVGPNSKSMRLLGDKIGARNFLKKHNIPLLPSYEGDDQSDSRLKSEAETLGYPLLIKPSAGGGGKGMEKVYSSSEFQDALASSKRIAASAFKDDRVFLEKLVEDARHIEVQILADEKGNVMAFGERECSLQRRHQKVIEETPCDFLSASLRSRIYDSSIKIAREAGYQSAGTVEWIWDGRDEIYFLEVNARLQVEHPVTEEVWGIDLVEWQLKIAQGESIKSLKSSPTGHAIEARLCAEDPANGFLPSGGKIHRLVWPDDVRVDSGFYEKNEVPPQFDSLMAKIIAKGKDRGEALQNLQKALEQIILFGPKTNRSYLIQILKNKDVREGRLSTEFLAGLIPQFDVWGGMKILKSLGGQTTTAVGEDEDLDYDSPWGRISRPRSDIFFEDFGDKRFIHTTFEDWTLSAPKAHRKTDSNAETQVEAFLKSPMPAKIIRVLVSDGEMVKKNQALIVLEAMKMEHQLKAPADLKVEKIFVKEGERVGFEAKLLDWEISKSGDQ